jgi:hypothetical protein
MLRNAQLGQASSCRRGNRHAAEGRADRQLACRLRRVEGSGEGLSVTCYCVGSDEAGSASLKSILQIIHWMRDMQGYAK